MKSTYVDPVKKMTLEELNAEIARLAPLASKKFERYARSSAPPESRQYEAAELYREKGATIGFTKSGALSGAKSSTTREARERVYALNRLQKSGFSTAKESHTNKMQRKYWSDALGLEKDITASEWRKIKEVLQAMPDQYRDSDQAIEYSIELLRNGLSVGGIKDVFDTLRLQDVGRYVADVLADNEQDLGYYKKTSYTGVRD